MAETGLKERAVQGCIKRLEAKRILISKAYRHGGRGKASVFTVHPENGQVHAYFLGERKASNKQYPAPDAPFNRQYPQQMRRLRMQTPQIVRQTPHQMRNTADSAPQQVLNKKSNKKEQARADAPSSFSSTHPVATATIGQDENPDTERR